MLNIHKYPRPCSSLSVTINESRVDGGRLSLSPAPLNWRIVTADFSFFSFFLFALPPVSLRLASIYIFRFPLPRPGFGKRLNTVGRLSCGDAIANVFSFLFYTPPLVRYADYPQQGVEGGLVFKCYLMVSHGQRRFRDAFFAFSLDLNHLNRTAEHK